MQKRLTQVMHQGIESLNMLEDKIKGRATEQPFEQLKGSLSLAELISRNFMLVEQLREESYAAVRSRKDTTLFIKQQVDVFKGAMAEKQINYKEQLECHAPLFVDENLAQCVMSSLLSNALEHSPRRASILVSSQELDKYVLLKVQNSAQIREDLLDTFADIYVTRDLEHGNGIGSYLAFTIAKLMGGAMYFHSSEKHGTEFYWLIPK